MAKYKSKVEDMSMTPALLTKAEAMKQRTDSLDNRSLEWCWYTGKDVNTLTTCPTTIYGSNAVVKAAWYMNMHADRLYACERVYECFTLGDLYEMQREAISNHATLTYSHVRILAERSVAPVRKKLIARVTGEKISVTGLNDYKNELLNAGHKQVKAPRKPRKKHDPGLVKLVKGLNKTIDFRSMTPDMKIYDGYVIRGSVVKLQIDRDGYPYKFVLE